MNNKQESATKEEIGIFIKNLREKNNMTQENLADAINYSRSVISRIERGEMMPSHDKMLLLSDYFHINVYDLYAAKILSEETVNEITPIVDNVKKVLDKDYRKRKNIITISFIGLIILFILSFLAYYFINSYNSVKVYKVYGSSANFQTNEGLFILTKENIYFSLTITSPDYLEVNKVVLKFKDSNKDIKVLETTKTNIFLVDFYKYNSYFNYDDVINLKGQFYIEIESLNNKEIINLNLDKLYENKNLIFTQNPKKTTSEEYNYKNNNVPRKIEENFIKNDNLYTYNIENDNYNLSMLYNLDTNEFTVIEESKDYVKSWIYNMEYKLLDYSYIKNDKLLIQKTIDANSMDEEKAEIYSDFKDNFIAKYLE